MKPNDLPELLVVEDHYETLVFLELVLADAYVVHTATSGSEALTKTHADSYDLLLVDIALRDEIDGIELVRRLREEPAFADTPMIATTAHLIGENEQYYIDRGFDACIPKPFFPQDLLRLIERLLSRPQRLQPAATS